MEQEIDPTQKGNYVFPFYLQSVPRGFTDIAVARHVHSVCTAVGPATTSQACVTACLASREPCAMKVSTQAPWRVVGRIRLPQGHRCHHQLWVVLKMTRALEMPPWHDAPLAVSYDVTGTIHTWKVNVRKDFDSLREKPQVRVLRTPPFLFEMSE